MKCKILEILVFWLFFVVSVKSEPMDYQYLWSTNGDKDSHYLFRHSGSFYVVVQAGLGVQVFKIVENSDHVKIFEKDFGERLDNFFFDGEFLHAKGDGSTFSFQFVNADSIVHFNEYESVELHMALKVNDSIVIAPNKGPSERNMFKKYKIRLGYLEPDNNLSQPLTISKFYHTSNGVLAVTNRDVIAFYSTNFFDSLVFLDSFSVEGYSPGDLIFEYEGMVGYSSEDEINYFNIDNPDSIYRVRTIDRVRGDDFVYYKNKDLFLYETRNNVLKAYSLDSLAAPVFREQVFVGSRNEYEFLDTMLLIEKGRGFNIHPNVNGDLSVFWFGGEDDYGFSNIAFYEDNVFYKSHECNLCVIDLKTKLRSKVDNLPFGQSNEQLMAGDWVNFGFLVRNGVGVLADSNRILTLDISVPETPIIINMDSVISPFKVDGNRKPFFFSDLRIVNDRLLVTAIGVAGNNSSLFVHEFLDDATLKYVARRKATTFYKSHFYESGFGDGILSYYSFSHSGSVLNYYTSFDYVSHRLDLTYIASKDFREIDFFGDHLFIRNAGYVTPNNGDVYIVDLTDTSQSLSYTSMPYYVEGQIYKNLLVGEEYNKVSIYSIQNPKTPEKLGEVSYSDFPYFNEKYMAFSNEDDGLVIFENQLFTGPIVVHTKRKNTSLIHRDRKSKLFNIKGQRVRQTGYSNNRTLYIQNYK